MKTTNNIYFTTQPDTLYTDNDEYIKDGIYLVVLQNVNIVKNNALEHVFQWTTLEEQKLEEILSADTTLFHQRIFVLSHYRYQEEPLKYLDNENKELFLEMLPPNQCYKISKIICKGKNLIG